MKGWDVIGLQQAIEIAKNKVQSLNAQRDKKNWVYFDESDMYENDQCYAFLEYSINERGEKVRHVGDWIYTIDKTNGELSWALFSPLFKNSIEVHKIR